MAAWQVLCRVGAEDYSPAPLTEPDVRASHPALWIDLSEWQQQLPSLLLRRVLGEKLELDEVASLMLGIAVPADPGARSLFAKVLLANFLNSLDALAGHFESKPIRRARALERKRDLDR